MYALLGDFTGTVKVPGMDKHYYFRASVYEHIGEIPKMKVGIAELGEEDIPAVYDLPVVVFDGVIKRRYDDTDIHGKK